MRKIISIITPWSYDNNISGNIQKLLGFFPFQAKKYRPFFFKNSLFEQKNALILALSQLSSPSSSLSLSNQTISREKKTQKKQKICIPFVDNGDSRGWVGSC